MALKPLSPVNARNTFSEINESGAHRALATLEGEPSARTICKLSERSPIGRSSSWFAKKTRRTLSEVFLQFDYDNQGFLSRAKLSALFLRYSPTTSGQEVQAIFRRYSKHDRVDYQSFVTMVGHEQQRGKFNDCFEPSIHSMDLMFETEQTRRTNDLQRLLDKTSPRRQPADLCDRNHSELEMRKQGTSTKNIFRGIRTYFTSQRSVGESLLAAVEEYNAARRATETHAKNAEENTNRTKLPPIHLHGAPTLSVQPGKQQQRHQRGSRRKQTVVAPRTPVCDSTNWLPADLRDQILSR